VAGPVVVTGLTDSNNGQSKKALMFVDCSGRGSTSRKINSFSGVFEMKAAIATDL